MKMYVVTFRHDGNMSYTVSFEGSCVLDVAERAVKYLYTSNIHHVDEVIAIREMD